MSDHERDRACIERLRAGEMAALEDLYDRYTDLLFSIATRIVGSAVEAEEVVQDAWVQVWRSADRFDPARGSVGAWLVTIARSRALDKVRSATSRARAESAAGVEAASDPAPISAGDVADLVAARASGDALAGALGQLEPKHRQVLELAYFAGLSQSEIAERLAAPLGTVKSWTRQALDRLRDLVPQEGAS